MAFATRLIDVHGRPVDRHMSADQFLTLDTRLPRIAQLIDGEVVVDSPTVRHQQVVGELYLRWRAWIDAGPGRGQCGFHVDVKLDTRNVYVPDLWWYCEDRKPGVGDFRLPLLPDLGVEVLSPSNRRYDLGVKRARYEQAALPELWIVDPMGVSATLLRRSAADAPAFDVTVEVGWDGALRSRQLPGFAVRLADLVG